MRSLAVLCALALTGCATTGYTPEFTILAGQKRIEDNTEVGVMFTLLQRFGEKGHGVGGCGHGSDPQHGKPFNDDDEMVFDLCGAGGRWGGVKK